MLERTIAISARHMASPEVEKLFITVKSPESLLPSYRQLIQFLEMNIRKYVRTEGIRDYGQEVYDGPAPDNKAIEDEQLERETARNEMVEAERARNREANRLPDRDPPKPKATKPTKQDEIREVDPTPAERSMGVLRVSRTGPLLADELPGGARRPKATVKKK